MIKRILMSEAPSAIARGGAEEISLKKRKDYSLISMTAFSFSVLRYCLNAFSISPS